MKLALIAGSTAAYAISVAAWLCLATPRAVSADLPGAAASCGAKDVVPAKP